MAKKRGRPSKTVLGQTPKVKENIELPKVEAEETIGWVNPELEEAVELKLPFEEPVVETAVEEPEEELSAPEQPIEQEVASEEEVKEEVVVKKVSDLNPAEYRYYLNTGKMPQ